MTTPIIPDGKISRAVREGLELRGKLLADGMDETEADRIVGQGLKAAWQDSVGNIERSWGFYCNQCQDTGWIEVAPDVQRLNRLYGANGAAHPFYKKCEPCRWQNRQREIASERKAATEA